MSLTKKIWRAGNPEPPEGVLSDITTAPPNWFRELPRDAAELYAYERFNQDNLIAPIGPRGKMYDILVLNELNERKEFSVTVRTVTEYRAKVEERTHTDTIHILRHGFSYCDIPNVPAQWPAGHRWVSFDDTEHLNEVTCRACRVAAGV